MISSVQCTHLNVIQFENHSLSIYISYKHYYIRMSEQF